MGDSQREESGAFTDMQLLYMQLLCNMAGGILEQLDQYEQKQKETDRMQACVDVTVAVNKARSLPDFEQRVKHLLGSFFDVNTVRVLFYNEDTNKLLISSAQMKKVKECQSISIEKGVVGL